MPFGVSVTYCQGFPGDSDGKEPACNVGDAGSTLSQEDPLEEEMATHSSFLPGEFHGQRNLVGYRPWGRKELDMTEQPRLPERANFSRQKR